LHKCVVRAVLLLSLATAADHAVAQAVSLSGQLGVLGEWELSAKLSREPGKGNREFSGPLSLKHVGMCSQDGPEEKAGTAQVQLVGSSRVVASFVIDGVTCTYRGRKSDTYSGVMSCPGKSDVPILLWIDEPK
jgi:hypothetical protein